jgi:hypothetical protein
LSHWDLLLHSGIQADDLVAWYRAWREWLVAWNNRYLAISQWTSVGNGVGKVEERHVLAAP